MIDFKEKVMWITGASSGIGKALALDLSEKGANLILSSRNEEELNAVKSSCARSDQHLVLPLDLEQYERMEEKANTALEKFGHVDVLFNNAGITQRSYVRETTLQVDQRVMNTNFFGSVALTKAILPSMLKRETGHIVVTSSVSGKMGVPLRSAYCASKHALHGFFDAMRAELWDQGIRVTIICPGFVQTQVSVNALIGDGSSYQKMDEATANGITPENCANEIIKAMVEGKDELILAQGKERFGVFMKRFFPSIFNKLIRKVKVT
ncbi:MAG: SDR family oxidoreductase [SAR324 cluster bacterium]|nr:SDR family oxidoreductase [SAR324 cluster bacterium]